MPLDVVARDVFLSIPDLLKATPSEEGDHRYLYLEASNEARDYQGEVVQAKALQESAEYFQRYGNLDIQHRSIIGLANGDPEYHLHEIGRPIEVKADGTRTFVKGEIFQGETPVAKCANDFWDSLTKLRPAQRWYPSVGGKIKAVEKRLDPKTREPTRHITQVIWSNIGFSRTPVNPAVESVRTVPFGVLAKCWGADGFDLDAAVGMTKALEAGYGTDSATLTGGAALRTQSLNGAPQSYEDFRERLAKALRDGTVSAHARAMLEHATEKWALPPELAGEYVERFFGDLKDGLKGKRS